jgi:DNA polymerase elongation subunit (family B)
MDIHSLVSKLKELANEMGKTPTLREFVASGVSKRQIQKHKFSEICKAAGLEPNPRSQTTSPIEPVIRPPRILYFDIETSYMVVKTYRLKTDYISHKNIISDWHFLSYAAMFEGEDTIYYLDQRFAEDKSDDRQLIEGLHDLLSQADIVVGHNIDGFDLKKFNTRAAKHGLDPLPPFQTHDTLKIARKFFSFSSNSLSFVAKFLGLDNHKSEHGKFPGDSLWEECMKGNFEAWDECMAYNQQDVRVTRDLYLYLAKYDPRINHQSFYQKTTCSCGSQSFYKDGHRFTKQGKFQIYRCHECGKTFTAKENLIDKDLRKGFFK